jgi:hypothetical protein
MLSLLQSESISALIQISCAIAQPIDLRKANANKQNLVKLVITEFLGVDNPLGVHLWGGIHLVSRGIVFSISII